ncbi:MAG: CPBP family intramembrane metalloprotease [Saprospiraceae bacterium]|nr:CPBP family intramembrane metalloprotease [Pyrinomonadaceae bacterium]
MAINQLLLTIFFNNFGRLRSGWRSAIFVAAFILTAAILGAAAMSLLYALPMGFGPGTAGFFIVNGLVSLVPALFVGWLCGKYLEGLPFRVLGAWFTKGWLKHLGIGIVLGAATLGIAVLTAVVFGGLSFELNSGAGSLSILSTLGVSFLIFTVAAAFEEAFFRGYILQTFTRAGLAWPAILFTSVLFGVVHIYNPDAGTISTVNTILAGVWFGIAYLKTRDLWFVLGLHLMWNWMQGAFFGIEVSGLTDIVTAPLLREIDSGPVWLTGESYGIEGGIACTFAIIISIAAIHFLAILKPDDELLGLTDSENGKKVQI